MSLPLTPMQQGMLYHQLTSPNSGVDILQLACRLHESLDVEAFQEAWQRIVARHEALRTGFDSEHGIERGQQVQDSVLLPFEFEDWQEVDEDAQERRFQDFVHEDRIRGFDLSQAPLIRISVFRLGPREHRCVLTFHHIIMDGRSLLAVVPEAFELYEAIRKGRSGATENAVPFSIHLERLQRIDHKESEAHWRSLLQGFTSPTPVSSSQSANEATGQTGQGAGEIRGHTIFKYFFASEREHALHLHPRAAPRRPQPDTHRIRVADRETAEASRSKVPSR
ncbi:MAG: hypothetical protein IIC82_09775 [Chloroflexi bacterium]|nr:hypothetical protein [Chloroflexota bacterium]